MSRCMSARSSAQDAVRVAHPGIMKPCVDRDSLTLNCRGFVTTAGTAPSQHLRPDIWGGSCQTSVLVDSVLRTGCLYHCSLD